MYQDLLFYDGSRRAPTKLRELKNVQRILKLAYPIMRGSSNQFCTSASVTESPADPVLETEGLGFGFSYYHDVSTYYYSRLRFHRPLSHRRIALVHNF